MFGILSILLTQIILPCVIRRMSIRINISISMFTWNRIGIHRVTIILSDVGMYLDCYSSRSQLKYYES